MEMFVVQGGAPLSGSVSVSGSKNAALPVMAAALAAEGRTCLRNVPDLVDVATLGRLLEALGAHVARDSQGGLQIEVVNETPCLAEYELVRRMRASVCVLGPLLARRGRAVVSLPGGCNIGHRPIDVHLRGLAALGAEIEVRNGYVIARSSRLIGRRISLLGPHGATVTGTCNVMTAACLAKGTTVIESAACEPEVVALARFLNRMGARIQGEGTPELVIDGVERLQATEWENIPDRIEAATLLIAAAMTRGSVSIPNAEPDHLKAVLNTLSELRVDVSHDAQRGLTVRVDRPLAPHDVTATPYPGLPTDVQAQLTALLSKVPGSSRVRDLVFPERFMHVAELCRMGADIRQRGSSAVIRGVPFLTGAHVMASDLRASAALVLAALAAEGESIVRRIYHLDRGYQRLEEKLTRLGATVLRCQDDGRSAPLPDTLATVPQRPLPIPPQRKSA